MRNSNRTRIRRIVSSPITIGVMAILVFFLGRAAWNAHRTAQLAEDKLSQAENQLGQLQDQQASLSQAVGSMSTDAGVEAQLRTKYRAVKPGELVAVIVDASTSSDVGTSPDDMQAGWWGRVLQFFGL